MAHPELSVTQLTPAHSLGDGPPEAIDLALRALAARFPAWARSQVTAKGRERAVRPRYPGDVSRDPKMSRPSRSAWAWLSIRPVRPGCARAHARAVAGVRKKFM